MVRYLILSLSLALAGCQTIDGVKVTVDLPCPQQMRIDPVTGLPIAVINGQPVYVEIISTVGTLKICRILETV